AFYGRLGAYETGLNERGLEGLKGALRRNLYGDKAPSDGVLDSVAAYMIGSLGTLALVEPAAWEAGRLWFAQPQWGA
ncbi:ubiquinol-cytochrome C chaperone, partial [Enterococcus hirae]